MCPFSFALFSLSTNLRFRSSVNSSFTEKGGKKWTEESHKTSSSQDRKKIICAGYRYCIYCARILFLLFGEAGVSWSLLCPRPLLWFVGELSLAADVREQQQWGCSTRRDEPEAAEAVGDSSTGRTLPPPTRAQPCGTQAGPHCGRFVAASLHCQGAREHVRCRVHQKVHLGTAREGAICRTCLKAILETRLPPMQVCGPSSKTAQEPAGLGTGILHRAPRHNCKWAMRLIGALNWWAEGAWVSTLSER